MAGPGPCGGGVASGFSRSRFSPKSASSNEFPAARRAAASRRPGTAVHPCRRCDGCCRRRRVSGLAANSAAVSAPGFCAFGLSAPKKRKPSFVRSATSTSTAAFSRRRSASLCCRKPSHSVRDTDSTPLAGPRRPLVRVCHLKKPNDPPSSRAYCENGPGSAASLCSEITPAGGVAVQGRRRPAQHLDAIERGRTRRW